MNRTRRMAVCALFCCLFIVSGCEEATPSPTDIPTSMPTMAAVEAPTMPEPTPRVGQQAVCWYGVVHSLPSDAQYDDYLALVPEEAGELGIAGATDEMEETIVAMRDDADQGLFAHFWGEVFCDKPAFAGCQFEAERVRLENADEPVEPVEPEPVEGWEGVVESTGEDAEFDDYFVLAGDYPVRFGIDSTDPTLAEQIEALRDTEIPLQIWGEISCGVPDVNGTLIQVSRME